VLLRPDRVVMDVVPSGGHDFTGTATWAPLLHTTRSPFPPQPAMGESLLMTCSASAGGVLPR